MSGLTRPKDRVCVSSPFQRRSETPTKARLRYNHVAPMSNARSLSGPDLVPVAAERNPMKSPPRDGSQKTRIEIEDVSGENWDTEVIDLLHHESESDESVIRPDDTFPSPAEKQNDLSRADLSGANLSEAHLDGAELVLARLSHAELRRASLAGAHLSYANLHEADLKDIDLSNADLSFATLTQTDLRGARMFGANLENADLRAADLRGVNLINARLTRTELAGAIFNEATRLPFDRKEALDLGMIFMESDSQPDVEVDSGDGSAEENG